MGVIVTFGLCGRALIRLVMWIASSTVLSWLIKELVVVVTPSGVDRHLIPVARLCARDFGECHFPEGCFRIMLYKAAH